MAKKKSKETVKINQKEHVENLLKELCGDTCIVNGEEYAESKKIVIPISPMHDRALGGGIPEGSFVILTGPPKCGKTITCLDFAATAQKPEYNVDGDTRPVFIIPVEARLKNRDISGIKHLNRKNLTIITSTDDELLFAEKQLQAAELIVNNVTGAVIILDSFSSLCSEEERASTLGDRFRANIPNVLGQFCRKVQNVIPVKKSIVMGITHLITDTGPTMTKWAEASGRKIQYQADVKLRCTHIERLETDGVQVGQGINWICETSAIGPPGAKYQSIFRYNYGLDKEQEIIDICVDLGLIIKAGSWYKIGEEVSVQGIEKMTAYLKENPDKFNELNNSIRGIMEYPQFV